MAEDNQRGGLNNLSSRLDRRVPVFVREDGKLIELETDGENHPGNPGREPTQLKPNTWYCPVPEAEHGAAREEVESVKR